MTFSYYHFFIGVAVEQWRTQVCMTVLFIYFFQLEEVKGTLRMKQML